MVTWRHNVSFAFSSLEFRRSHASGVIRRWFPEGGHHVHDQQRHGSAPTSSIESRKTKVGQPKISGEHHSSLMRRERSEGIQNRQGRTDLFKTADLNPGPTVFQKGRYEENPKSTGMLGTSPAGRNKGARSLKARQRKGQRQLMARRERGGRA
jgi:hypothetical protein